MRIVGLLALTVVIALAGCIGPVALHEAVLLYDESVGRLERELLLLNIARTHQRLPGHFTVTSSVTATFDYRANLGVFATYVPQLNWLYGANVNTSVAESPTMTILPVQGEEFSSRILTPLDERKFQSLLFQGVALDMLVRLMSDGLELYNPDGALERFVANWPGRREEYEEFRRRALHLAWLQTHRQLSVEALTFDEAVLAALPTPLSGGEQLVALERGWRPAGLQAYELKKPMIGRIVITNYDPRTLTNAERLALNTRAAANGRNVILVDVRTGHPGGEFPLSGAIRLRSLNLILAFLAAGIEEAREIDVAPDPRTGAVGQNPRRTLGIEVTDNAPGARVPQVAYRGKYYSVADTAWDREAFRLLHQLFQMGAPEAPRPGVPGITISK